MTRSFIVLACALALVACNDSHQHHADASLDGGSGGAGSGGAGGDDASGGMGGSSVSGSGGGGDGGSGGAGGEPFTGVECDLGGFDDVPEDTCWPRHDGWFAVRHDADVWWSGNEVIDPGRGTLQTYALLTLGGECPGGLTQFVTAKPCGLTLPTFTSDATCSAHALRIDDSAWEGPGMPRTLSTVDFDAIVAGDAFTLNSLVTSLGIDLFDHEADGAWPLDAGHITCEAGDHTDCFPDHDSDGMHGISLHSRVDGSVYVGPYDTGLCSTGAAYRHQGFPTRAPVVCGGCTPGSLIRVEHVAIGLRTTAGADAQLDDRCTHADGSSEVGFDWRAIACDIEPASLDPNDIFEARDNTMDYACTPDEATQLDRLLPTLHTLRVDELLGEPGIPPGWLAIGRDFDHRPGNGGHATMVRLASLDASEPSCADVRAAFVTND